MIIGEMKELKLEKVTTDLFAYKINAQRPIQAWEKLEPLLKELDGVNFRTKPSAYHMDRIKFLFASEYVSVSWDGSYNKSLLRLGSDEYSSAYLCLYLKFDNGIFSFQNTIDFNKTYIETICSHKKEEKIDINSFVLRWNIGLRRMCELEAQAKSAGILNTLYN